MAKKNTGIQDTDDPTQTAPAQTTPAGTNRQKLVDRFKKSNPDFNADDDESLYSAANDALNKSDEIETQRKRLNNAISKTDIAPEMLQGLLSGKNPDGTDFDLEDYLFNKHLDFFIDYLENKDGAKQKLESRKAERKKTAAEEAELKKTEVGKIKKEDSELDAAIAETGYKSEQVKDLIDWIYDAKKGIIVRASRFELNKDDFVRLFKLKDYDVKMAEAKDQGYKSDQVKDLIDWIYDAKKGIIVRASRFELNKDDFVRLFKLKDYDVKMAEAKDQGYKKGKNEKIDMFSHRQQQRKSMPPDLNSGSSNMGVGKKRDKTLDALDRMGKAFG